MYETSTILLIISIFISIALTVLLFIKVLPKKFDGTFSKKTLQFTHDFFNFKKLYLEEVLKIIYTFATVTCISVGAFFATIGNLIRFVESIIDYARYDVYSIKYIFIGFFSRLVISLAIAVLGPIVLRLVYEGIMMFILLVKNVIDINKKLK